MHPEIGLFGPRRRPIVLDLSEEMMIARNLIYKDWHDLPSRLNSKHDLAGGALTS